MARPASRARTLPLRPLASLTAALFVVSTAFPVAAGLVHSPNPHPLVGYLDVALAAVLFGLVLLLDGAPRGDCPPAVILASYHGYRLLSTLALVLVAAFFVAGDRVALDILLPGLAWRTWLFVYGLPALVSALGPR